MKVKGNRTNGLPCWADLRVADVPRAKEFYSALLGWRYEEARPEPAAATYATALVNGDPVAAFIQIPTDEPAWNIYFSADDVDATAEQVVRSGGKILDGPGDLMGQGRYAVVQDFAGARFSLWHGTARTGFDVVEEPGAFAWFEYRSTDTGRARDFYAAVLDRPVESMNIPDFDYLTVQEGEQSVAGVWGVPDEKDRWTLYAAVPDTDQAVVTAREAGGTVVTEPFDSYYGRVAWIKDPFGAELAVMTPPAEGSGS